MFLSHDRELTARGCDASRAAFAELTQIGPGGVVCYQGGCSGLITGAKRANGALLSRKKLK
jgi:hypothetical protein